MGCAGIEDKVSLFDGAAERDHRNDVGEAEGFTGFFEGETFEGKRFSVFFMCVARGAAESEHRVFFVGFKIRSTDETGVFVGFKIRESDEDWIGVADGGDLGEALGEFVDKIVLWRGVGGGEFLDEGALFFGGDFVEVDEGHRMDLDDVVDDKFHSSKTDTLGGEIPSAPRFVGA